MWNFLRPDSKFMFYANKFCDLIALNLVMLIFCIPIFTIGTSLTAMHYVLLKILRDELSRGVIRTFWTAFKNNFRQASLLWLIYLPVGVLIVLDLLLFNKGLLPLPRILKYLLIALGIVWMLSLNWALIRNSFLFCLFHPVDSILISAVLCIPYALVVFLPQLTPVVLFCGFGLSGILSTALYNRIFIRHERDTSSENCL